MRALWLLAALLLLPIGFLAIVLLLGQLTISFVLPQFEPWELYERVTRLPYDGEAILYDFYREDLDSDALTELVLEVDRSKVTAIVGSTLLGESEVPGPVLAGFGPYRIPEGSLYYRNTIERKGTLEAWYHEPSRRLFLRDDYCC